LATGDSDRRSKRPRSAATYDPAALSTIARIAALALLVLPAPAAAAPPDPLERGPYAVTTIDPFRAGTVDLQEPNAGGGAPTGSSAPVTLQIRGSLYFPADRPTPAPVIVLVHGNHGSCDSGQSPNCTAFKRNDRGYAYLGENLASWGYAVASLDQDQLIAFQDGLARGMHQRRRLIAAALDALYAANQAPLPDSPNANVGAALIGRLDMARIGLMGHSRGGDAVTSFIDDNRTRPSPGRRYQLRGVISLAPTDYERRAPYGTPYLTILPYCDGDVSNLMGARMYERGQYIAPGDPFPRIQMSMHGANHNWFNSVWFVDGQDNDTNDAACDLGGPTSIRLSGGTYTLATRGSGDPALMGDQERAGLATMGAFFRRYVGGETEFEPYMTGELTQQLPSSACPSSEAGLRIACDERLMTSYFPGAAERLDVIRPEPDDPLGVSAVGTALTGSGFSNPFLADGGVSPVPATTAGGYDWCNPEPLHFTPSAVGGSGRPTAEKSCPLPADGALGGQGGTREAAPINHSYGLQLALAWDQPAALGTRIPVASGDVSGFEALAMGAAVNFFDPRNPARGDAGEWNPAATTQDFAVVLIDRAGREATVSAASARYGNALHQSLGDTTPKTHVVLNQVRIPLADFAAQGVDLQAVRRIELRFGGPGMPQTGSIQLADVRFQEPADEAGVEGAAAVPAPAAAPATACADILAPAVRVVATRVAGRRLIVRGTAVDAGCGAGVRSVRVTLAGKGIRRTVVAGGAGRWTARFARRLAAGRYRITVRTTDLAGNAGARRAIVRVR
jgi:Big-like domain-containing protein